uniref:Si:ch211-242e8.1 n=1 Tax=Cyprinus carpio TaxID=7962 RepID=A0A8C2BAE6_CYPCA
MTSAWSLMWVVCGLTVWFPHTHGASVNPRLLMTASDPTTDEQPINPEHLTESTDPPSNNTASLSPNLLIPTFDSTTDEQPINAEHPTEPTDLISNNDTGLACISVLPPRRGSYYVEHGTGVSVGSMLVFWCKEGYQLVGHEKITCILHAGVPRWSSYLPVCESIPRSNDQGLHIALLVSVVSGVVIFVMTVCFIICCCQECMRKKKEKLRMGRSRRRETRSSGSRRSPSWLEREHIDWEAFPPPKLFSLSQRLDRPLPPGSPVYSEVIRAYENRGYESRNQWVLHMMEDVSPLITCSDEYRLLETYCQKRRKPRARLMQSACMYSLEAQSGDEQFGDVAEKLTQIVDKGLLDEELPQTVDKRLTVDEGLESDGGVKDVDQDVIDKLVDLLKKSGDNLNERIQSNHELLGYLQRTFSYDLFKKLTKTFITSVVPEYLQRRRKREQIALAFEVTSRLKTLDLHPMNRAMGYGAQYLQEYFAPWVQQHGGWEKAFDNDDDEEVH